MNHVLCATAVSLALACGEASFLGASAQAAVAAAPAAKTSAPQEKTVEPKKTAESKVARTGRAADKAVAKVVDELNAAQPVSQASFDLAGWVIATGDNRELPFAIVDKEAAQILVFGADGRIRGLAPVLVGSATGDDSAPGVGDRELKDIPAGDRTTPAGRYLAAYGPAAGGKSVLWVDYATAISVHAIPPTKASVKEKRKQRLASKTPDDNRITHGCINVSPTFYSKVVQPVFRKTGVFYVLPDSEPLQAAFPGFEPPTRFASSDGED